MQKNTDLQRALLLVTSPSASGPCFCACINVVLCGAASNAQVEFNDATLRQDFMSQMPDLLIYVSKKGAKYDHLYLRFGRFELHSKLLFRRDKCVGYLRIPLNGTTSDRMRTMLTKLFAGVKRPTESWEHGEDLTVFPDIMDAKKAQVAVFANSQCLSVLNFVCE